MENNQANQSLNTSNGGQTTFTQATFNAWLNDFFTTKFNSLSYSNQRLPKRMEKLVLDLSVAPAQPVKIPVPFKSCLVSRVFSTAVTSTDKAGSVSIMFDYDNLMNQTNAVQLFVNDSFVMDTSVSQAFLTWTAQADTSITLYFFVDIDYRAGTTKTQIVGTVTTSPANTSNTNISAKSYPIPSSRVVLAISAASGNQSSTIPSGKYARVSFSAETVSMRCLGSIGGVQIFDWASALTSNREYPVQLTALAGEVVNITTGGTGTGTFYSVIEIYDIV